MAAVGGLALGALNGFQLPNFKPFNGKKVPSVLGKIHIPPIIAMIVMGCVVRNAFGDVVKPYNSSWAQWVRTCCLGILLTRGGMTISFTGKGILVITMTFIPLFFEATTAALIALGVFKMPIEMAYTLGFALASVAPAIVVP